MSKYKNITTKNDDIKYTYKTGDFQRNKLQNNTIGSQQWNATKGPVIWSRVPETTLPPSYPGRGNI